MAQAAERESIAVSAASRRITEFDARLGTPLLHRYDRGVTPTVLAGDVLLVHLDALFDLLDRIGTDMELHLRPWRTDRLVVVLPRNHALTARPSPGESRPGRSGTSGPNGR